MTSLAANHNGATPLELLPPQSVEAEEFVLAAAFAGDESADELVGTLRPAEFYHQTHRIAMEAIMRLRRADTPIDGLMFPEELVRAGVERQAAFALAMRLHDLAFQADHFHHWAGIVREDWQRREVIALAGILREMAHSRQLPADSVIATAETKLVALNERGADDGGIDAAELFLRQQQRIESGEEPHYFRTGKRYLDRLLKPSCGDVLVIGGRPNMGKTARALSLALDYARKQHSVAFFSGEMAVEQIADRALSQVSGVSLTAISDLACSDSQARETAHAALSLAMLPIRFYDTCGTVPAIRARVLKQRRGLGVEIVVIDQLNRLEATVNTDGNENLRFSLVMRELKNAAKSLGVFVIVLHQLSRKLEARADKRPMLADLRDSGNIEAEADIVGFVYRDSYYTTRSDGATEPPEGPAEFILAKVRQGELGTIRDIYDRSTQRFYQVDTYHDEGGAGPSGHYANDY